MVHRIAVIGAGAVGLSAALSIQQQVPDAKVTLVSERFDEGTTSWGAAGFFLANLDKYPKDRERVRRWWKDTWIHFKNLTCSDHAKESGMFFAAGTMLYDISKDSGYALMAELAHDFQKLDESQMKKMGLPVQKYDYGYSFTTVITHTPTYLKWLMQRLLDCGVTVECRKITKLSELRDSFDVVVNCCGLNAAELCQDETVFPVMGHLIKVGAPWFKQFYWCKDFYIIPQTDYILVGGVSDKGNWSLAADPAIRRYLLSRAYDLFPPLKHAPVVGEWVGLRPGRESVRLEVEMISCGNKKPLPVVHNYGHTGSGIAMSWGCALESSRLVQGLLTGMRPRL